MKRRTVVAALSGLVILVLINTQTIAQLGGPTTTVPMGGTLWTPDAGRAEGAAGGGSAPVLPPDAGVAPASEREGSVRPGKVPATGGGPSAPQPSDTPVEDQAGDASGDGANQPGARKISAGKGRIEGVVVDSRSGEPLIEAQVTVLPLNRRVLTDVDGRYSVDVKPGIYDLRVFAELLRPRRFTSVKVESGRSTRLDMALGAEVEERIAVQEVVVVARPDVSTDAVQLVRRQKSSTVSDAISAEQIARTPDTSASEAVKRVVGATIQDNRYVIIRGLGGRYSLALLNGVPLPSPDPDLPSAPLDLFPSALLANLTVAKSFTPDLPGNFAGGALLIETRDYPTHFTLKLRISSALDTQATFRSVNTYEGGGVDFLGYDDGTRQLPSRIPRDRPAREPAVSSADLADMGRSFSNHWTLWKHDTAPSLGIAATVGDSLTVAGHRLGYLATASYADRWTRQKAHLALVGSRNPDGSYRPSDLQQDIDTGTETAAVGALVNVGFMLAPTHRLGLIALYTHSTEDSASDAAGVENNLNVVDRLRFRWLERRMQFNQLSGEHAFAGGKVVWNWQGHLALTAQNEPDTRDLLRVQGGDGVYRIGFGSGTAERTFGDLHELTGGAGTDLSVPFSAVRVKVGGGFIVSPRESRVRRFHFEARDADVAALPSEQAFRSENIGPAFQFAEVTQSSDAFDATRYVYSGFAMADVVKLDPIRIIAGARYEIATTNLTIGNSLGVNPSTITHLNRTDRAILPSASVVFSISERTNLRVAYGGTVARPHLRELSPSPYFDYVRRRVTSGNKDLDQTFIHNADLRWESFLTGSEVVAASAFYKYFSEPIERTAESAGDGQNISFKNAASAQEVGIELEARANGSRLHHRLEPFYLGANLTTIISRVHVSPPPGAVTSGETTRPLQGQSPYVVNAEIGFRNENTQVSLLYNVFGRRISEVGTAGNGDVYEEAFHRLDVACNQRLGHGLNLKLSATNLLNQKVSYRQGVTGDAQGVEIYGYLPGVAGLAALEWSYDPVTR
jgi:outer membrane receptor protein involved in Fe transport